MTRFDSIAIVDWSAGNDTGRQPRKDAVWVGSVLAGVAQEPVYLRNRVLAFEHLCDLIENELAAGGRLMIGFDFPFAYPHGFAEKLGIRDVFAVWDYFAQRLIDTPKSNNRFALAGQINALFPGDGPYWFNGLKHEIADLPRKKPVGPVHGQRERRRVEERAKGTFACWQMGGAGAVGGQVMTGMALLSKLRARFEGHIGVWPFEDPHAPVTFVEIWPSLIDRAVKTSGDPIKDRAQVRLLAQAFARLPQDRLAAMLDVETDAEGWILGTGFEEELLRAACH
ncbi:MAG: molybdopterin guanine dinucleotide synthesis [Silicimonas sp.]|nr:molybdopterin guanine dinucleotide synthesis [Silicimonas sp.]